MTPSQRHFLSTLILWDNDISMGFKLCDEERTLILNALFSKHHTYHVDIRKQLNTIRDLYLQQYGTQYVNGDVDLFEENYNFNELAHISDNYAINCMKGYQGNFMDWYKGLSSGWRKIANR